MISVELKNSAVLLQIPPPIFKEAVRFINLNVFFSDRYENKNRNRFEFGTSERMSLKEAAAKVQEQIAAVDILVTHGGAQDAELLDCCGISVTEKIMFDTQLLAMVLIQDRRLDLNNLKQLLVELEIPFDKNVRLYNSGNYAYLNAAVFLKLKDIAISRK